MGDMPNILQIETLLDLVEYGLKDNSEKEFVLKYGVYHKYIHKQFHINNFRLNLKINLFTNPSL